MTKREFIQQYVLNASIGAGRLQLNVEAAVHEADRAWKAMEKVSYPVISRWRKP